MRPINFVYTCAFQKFDRVFPLLPIGEIHRFLYTGDGLGFISQCLGEKGDWTIVTEQLFNHQIAFQSPSLRATVWFSKAAESHDMRCEVAAPRLFKDAIAKKLDCE